MVIATRHPDGEPMKTGMAPGGSGGQAVVVDSVERFLCPRCGYARPIKLGEDGLRLYLLHRERCTPAEGQQIWLPFVSEDDLDWSRWLEKTPPSATSLLVRRAYPERAGDGVGSLRVDSRKVA